MNCRQWVVDAVLWEPTPSRWKLVLSSQFSERFSILLRTETWELRTLLVFMCYSLAQINAGEKDKNVCLNKSDADVQALEDYRDAQRH
jgi:hypothetical protein